MESLDKNEKMTATSSSGFSKVVTTGSCSGLIGTSTGSLPRRPKSPNSQHVPMDIPPPSVQDQLASLGPYVSPLSSPTSAESFHPPKTLAGNSRSSDRAHPYN